MRRKAIVSYTDKDKKLRVVPRYNGELYSCPICEHLGTTTIFTHTFQNCPVCNINVDWQDAELRR